MKRIFFIAIALFALAACKHRKKRIVDTKILNYGTFTIEAPLLWGRVKDDSTNKNAGRIAIDNKDTIAFNYIAGGSEPTDTGKIIFADAANTQTKMKWKEIDGFNAKVVSPKQPGTGITGVYIDSIKVTGSAVSRFYLYGNNLSPDNEKDVLQAIKTLKFTRE